MGWSRFSSPCQALILEHGAFFDLLSATSSNASNVAGNGIFNVRSLHHGVKPIEHTARSRL